VPPAGVPEFLVCEDATALSCQDLNGDHAAQVGAGVYMADPAADWHPALPRRPDSTPPRGITFTAAEQRLLIDMLKSATVTTSSYSDRSVRAGRLTTTKAPSAHERAPRARGRPSPARLQRSDAEAPRRVLVALPALMPTDISQ
jgi:hypothetical protein